MYCIYVSVVFTASLALLPGAQNSVNTVLGLWCVNIIIRAQKQKLEKGIEQKEHVFNKISN